MALKDLNDNGGLREVKELEHKRDFDLVWNHIPPEDQAAIQKEIKQRLDHLLSAPDPKWGSITNTSIEGGRPNPITGVPGDWSGTPFDAIYQACGQDVQAAGMFYGRVWKKIIIEREETWIGVRFDPTFPQRGITLMGKTYFPDRS